MVLGPDSYYPSSIVLFIPSNVSLVSSIYSGVSCTVPGETDSPNSESGYTSSKAILFLSRVSSETMAKTMGTTLTLKEHSDLYEQKQESEVYMIPLAYLIS